MFNNNFACFSVLFCRIFSSITYIFSGNLKELNYNNIMKRRRPPIKPFEYGKFIIEYKDSISGLLRFHKERIDNYNDAVKVRDQLLSEGVNEPEIKRVG